MSTRDRINFGLKNLQKVPLTISYKTGKVNRKHIKFDIPNIEKFRLEIPLLEYKRDPSKNWNFSKIHIFLEHWVRIDKRVIFERAKSEVLTWQDLALRIKSDCKRALISQVSHFIGSPPSRLFSDYPWPVNLINSGSQKACYQNRKEKQNWRWPSWDRKSARWQRWQKESDFSY